ncbi:MAG: hypothetical protein EBS49_08495, partial [Verrucomicrobia bacterium]|nr:hypothetical protein [Verrucomicrobiota bacterium]
SRLRQDRRIRTLNHWLFLPILLFLFLGANYISWRHYFRADWSLNRFQQISGQTLNLLKNLPGEVVITTFVAPEGDSTGNLIQEDVLKLLEEYKYRAGGKVKLVTVHPYLDFQASQQLVEKFKLSSNENVVILEYGNRSKVLKVAEMAEIDPGMMMVGGAARVKSFLAEEKISSAVSELVQGKTPKVYVSQGHGEFNLQSSDQDPAGYSKLAATRGGSGRRRCRSGGGIQIPLVRLGPRCLARLSRKARASAAGPGPRESHRVGEPPRGARVGFRRQQAFPQSDGSRPVGIGAGHPRRDRGFPFLPAPRHPLD